MVRAPASAPRVRRRRRDISLPPPAMLALLYAALIVLGTGLLMLPPMQARPFGWGEAFFTATSAVTVTGLSVIDTGADLSAGGQAVVLGLIQLGGLGLMTFAVLVLAALGLPVGMASQAILREDLNQTSVLGLLKLVSLIVRVVLLFELVGMAALAVVFVPEFGWVAGLWSALFHAVSAFNNAGFSLYADSMTAWVANPIVSIGLPLLWLIGGLGFGVLSDLRQQKGWTAYSLHTKLMLSGSVALIAVSVLFFAVLEWRNPATLGGLDGTGARLMASWFQALTARTAGFNTLDTAAIEDSTALMMMTLMLIGGGSTSTAGGIKVTTFLVLILATIAFFRRQKALHAFGRSLGIEEVLKVMALTTLALLINTLSTFLLVAWHDGDFLDIAFEVASAFGTVGLSRGVTGDFDTAGRALLCALMFIGRVGPLTLGFFLATRVQPRIGYPAGKVYLG
jgi:trk system potassium uptake protein TrkH